VVLVALVVVAQGLAETVVLVLLGRLTLAVAVALGLVVVVTEPLADQALLSSLTLAHNVVLAEP
jgi:hypothetical protein